MISILYMIIIFPLVQVIELCFLFFLRVFNNPGMAICGLSLAVTLLTLPLYRKAETWQETERNIQNKMAPKIKKIKSVFSGDEQYMILSTYYRQNHYHPVYAMRSTFGLLIQIPFFIAAYSFLSHLEILNDRSFFGIPNLGSPDRILHLHTFSINILPIIMTAVNILASMVYAKGFTPREKVQLYAIAALFLILLYNSPAGLVLYWTLNNCFSLLKSVIKRFSISSRNIYFCLLPVVALFDIYILFLHPGILLKRLLLFFISILIILVPLMSGKIKKAIVQFKQIKWLNNHQQDNNTKFILSVAILFVLTGFVIPSALIFSSPAEFSFIESYKSPFPFLFNILFQSFGLFVLWPVCLYFFFSNKIRQYFSIIFSIAFLLAMANAFLVFENFGFLTNILIFSEPKPIYSNIVPIIINILVLIIITVLFFIVYNRSLFKSIQIIALSALIVLGMTNIFRIQSAFTILSAELASENDNNRKNRIEPFFNLSKNGKNVLLILLDKAVPGYIPEIFGEKPEIASAFSGFTWYPNCVSFANHTYLGAAPLYGGYEYSPIEVNKRDSVSVIEKQKEAYLVLPRLFMDSSWSVTINDPPSDNYIYSNLAWFREYPQIKADNLVGKYTSLWLKSHPAVSVIDIAGRLKKNLIRFSFFKISPLVFRNFIYDGGLWCTADNPSQENVTGALTSTILDDYVFLHYLPELTDIAERNENNFVSIYSRLTHDNSFFQAPDYTPSNNITNRGNGQFAEESRYHINMAALSLLGKYFTYLRENNIYDNTRIIIVSDHGRSLPHSLEGNIRLPNGEYLSSYQALLFIKDFYEKGDMHIDYEFMTNADAALFAVKDVIENPVNPFTKKRLLPQKENGASIATIDALWSRNHYKFRYNINSNQWLHVKDNIFVESNWSTKQ